MDPIVCLFTRSDCFRSGRPMTPRGVMLHSTGANNPWLRRYVAPDNGLLGAPSPRHWNQPGLEVCAHAFVGRLADGQVAACQTLPWAMRGWHAGRGDLGSANDTHISIEICEDGLEDEVYFRAAYETAAHLTARLCREFGLDPAADGVVLCHAEGYRREGAGRRKGSLTLCYTRRLTRYEVCLFTDRLSAAFWQNPFSRRKGRGTLLVKLPAGFYKIRSLRAGDAAALGL